MNQQNNIGIIGLGLIGGSIAKALKKRAPGSSIASLTRPCQDLERAVSERAVDRLFGTWEELIDWSEMIILAAPLSTLVPLAEEIAKRCPAWKRLLVIDVGSVKGATVPVFEALTTDNLEFLSTHPMAGKETGGFVSSEADLFQDCSWIVTPHGRNQSCTCNVVLSLLEVLGAKVAVMDAKTHDEQTALISHLPALLSRSLLKFVEKTNPESLKIAGPGFQSMTRLARDNPQMQGEIAELNKKELNKLLSLWIEHIKEEIKC